MTVCVEQPIVEREIVASDRLIGFVLDIVLDKPFDDIFERHDSGHVDTHWDYAIVAESIGNFIGIGAYYCEMAFACAEHI